MAHLSHFHFGMCECCGKYPSVTNVSAMLMAGSSLRSIRVAVCQKCRENARHHDLDTWERIRAVLLAVPDMGPKEHSL